MALVLLADGVAEATAAAAAPESVDSERLAMSDERAATVALLEGNTKIMSIVVGVCSSCVRAAAYPHTRTIDHSPGARQQLPQGWHTHNIECKGVFSIGV